MMTYARQLSETAKGFDVERFSKRFAVAAFHGYEY